MPIIRELVFLGGFAPALFFGVSGITTTLQLKKRQLTELVAFYLLFFYLGLSFNGIEQVKYWTYLESEIIQCISAGVLITGVLYKYCHFRQFAWLFPLPWLIHLLAVRLPLPGFPFKQFIFNPGIFPVFPWLSFFLLGVTFYHGSDRLKKFLTGIFGLLVLAFFLVHRDLYDKWNMTPGYFCLACFIFIVSFYLCRQLPGHLKPLLFLGKNSLLFLFAHYLVLRTIARTGLQQPVLTWSTTLILTILLMKLILIGNHFVTNQLNLNYAGHSSFWVLVGVVILLNPLVNSSDFVYDSSYLLGFLISANYHHLAKLVSLKLQHRTPGDFGYSAPH